MGRLTVRPGMARESVGLLWGRLLPVLARPQAARHRAVAARPAVPLRHPPVRSEQAACDPHRVLRESVRIMLQELGPGLAVIGLLLVLLLIRLPIGLALAGAGIAGLMWTRPTRAVEFLLSTFAYSSTAN